ncbi:MAG: helix-turn-helix domain-containing protein [Candidatus Binataceae bacterium]
MVDEKSETSGAAMTAGGRSAGEEFSLGKFLTEARNRGGYTAEQVASGTHIPPHYIKAIETDDYGLISDQLYLLPFLRRYAAFIGLDPEDVASRFVREVQKAETSAAKASEPIRMFTNDRKPGAGRWVVVLLILVAVGALVAVAVVKRSILLRHLPHFGSGTSTSMVEPAPPQPSAAVQAPSDTSSAPFASSVAPAPSAPAPEAAQTPQENNEN